MAEKKRKAIPKSVRFEVLKRDMFTCQYCGRKAPEVLLEVDHIKPVAEGGTNDILNLVTSCMDCNRGKGKKLLSDQSALAKSQKQAEEIQMRHEQIEMMAQWQAELQEEIETEIDMLEDLFEEYYPNRELTPSGRSKMRSCIKEFGYLETYEALSIALEKYDHFSVIDKVGGICYNRRNGRTADYYKGGRR